MTNEERNKVLDEANAIAFEVYKEYISNINEASRDQGSSLVAEIMVRTAKHISNGIIALKGNNNEKILLDTDTSSPREANGLIDTSGNPLGLEEQVLDEEVQTVPEEKKTT